MPPTNRRAASSYTVKVSQFSLMDTDTDGAHFHAEDPAILDILDSSDLLKALTKRQRPVAKLLAQGYTRQEVAEKRGVCLQAIHQMVPVMRRRIARHLEKQRAI